MRLLIAVLVSVSHLGFVRADTITFSPEIDADADANTSSVSPYSAGVTQSLAPAGIVDDGTSTTDTETFFFSDASTGIAFSFDTTWTAFGGVLNPTPTSALGVGDNSSISGSESLTISVADLAVDLSSYIAGSFNGILAPQLDGATVFFDRVSFTDFFSGGDATTVDILGSQGVETFSQSSGNFDLGLDGQTVSEASLNFALNSASVDDDFNVSATRFNVAISLSETAAVPEPSSALALLVGGIGLGIRRLRRRAAQSTTVRQTL